MSLREYKRKRDFSKTAEPAPVERKTRGAAKMFVIQKHAATRLHYDFRLEMDGVLKSWAVPKGLPYEKGERHLAVHVEDHPMDYARFEGIIPQGEYGGGTVMVWDIGTYEPLGDDPRGYMARKGVLHLLLHGEKVDGEWSLVRIGKPDPDGKEPWLLIKSGKSIRAVSKAADDRSVLTGRSMKRIAAEKDAEWRSNRTEVKDDLKSRIRAKAAATKPSSVRTKSKLQFVEPMKAKLVEKPPTSGDWIYELKFDGFRALGLKSDGNVELLSRNNKSLNEKFASVAESISELPCGDAIIDGEIVALDSEGRSSFQLLQAYAMEGKRTPLYFYAFDLLRLEGEDLRKMPLEERKKRLAALIEAAPEQVRFSSEIGGDPVKLLAEVRRRGLEGIIGKRVDSRYEAGLRSGAWIKLKALLEQEFVIGGYTEPQGSRKHFGALLVGVYEEDVLQFVTKVGTGFSAKLLGLLHKQFQPLVRSECPFANLPTQRSGRWGQGINRAEMKRCTWLEPKLVCQVRFTEWTRDGGIRHPAFIGMREDKDPKEVRREIPAGNLAS
jgi:bifunctional non-homologous end joining protein LigD